MLKRRLKDAGLSDAFSPHSFRATGITNFLENGGTLEVAQRIAGHADSRTTKLYDRRGQKVLLEDMERNAELGVQNVEHGKMWSKPDECALGLGLRVIDSTFYFFLRRFSYTLYSDQSAISVCLRSLQCSIAKATPSARFVGIPSENGPCRPCRSEI
jgi:hypothetical protein